MLGVYPSFEHPASLTGSTPLEIKNVLECFISQNTENLVIRSFLEISSPFLTGSTPLEIKIDPSLSLGMTDVQLVAAGAILP